ncbi:response regulator transcription factor [Shigella boydii]|uniref:Response regulator transcription factor n=1 Tax=Shigella boydii TaxID=621 RepID=A0A7G6KB37_SHIBO|nr:response regulator transcription factor [Shigella boydii]EFZ0078552.1 response regulator transcription factor [Shigella flexneri]EFS3866941.1 DNA-binding response regulator [Shigella boydii]EFZ0029818.1 response regulator transcription factor [Shigella boydii]EFZ6259310.1 response regulator transcription factor [Shigella boydii]EFZ6263265.1 response regulator transcription factor [Shigella boydii]
MLPGCCKNGIVISKIPVMQAGLKEVMRTHFPEYEIISSASAEDLTLLQLRCSGLVIADLAGESEDPRSVCEHYYSLISQYREIHWVFMVSRSWYSQAVELLMCPTATLLSDVEPIENLVKTVRSGNTHAERISAMLTSPAMNETHDFSYRSVILTLSERKVLRLLGKGWGINQIASLLKKSNKTISAQKNSAMRRLAIHSNAEMYAWINSVQGARELNLPSVYGDAAEWNTAELRREMSHS